MTILRTFIHSENLQTVTWQRIETMEVVDSGESSLSDALMLDFDQIELYLAPSLVTIIKVELGSVNDRKINDDLLLSLVEDQLAEEIDLCKPILLRFNDGVAYIAILSRAFHVELLSSLREIVKQVKFIQPFPFATVQEKDFWTIYLVGENKFVRTSQYEYFLLDDQKPLPVLLENMLANYDKEHVLLYCDDSTSAELLQSKYKTEVKVTSEYLYGVPLWNLYNEKSKRFDVKLNPVTITSLLKLGSVVSIFLAIFLTYWLINLGFLSYDRYRLQDQVSSDLSGIVAADKYSNTLLSQVDERLVVMQHDKGIYAKSDALYLLDIFLKSSPTNGSMIQGVQYSGKVLSIFLNSQFDNKGFGNDRAVLQAQRFRADLTDFKTYQNAQQQANKQNNGGGLLNSASAGGSDSSRATPTISDAAWVVTLQLISRMDSLNDGSSK